MFYYVCLMPNLCHYWYLNLIKHIKTLTESLAGFGLSTCICLFLKQEWHQALEHALWSETLLCALRLGSSALATTRLSKTTFIRVTWIRWFVTLSWLFLLHFAKGVLGLRNSMFSLFRLLTRIRRFSFHLLFFVRIFIVVFTLTLVAFTLLCGLSRLVLLSLSAWGLLPDHFINKVHKDLVNTVSCQSWYFLQTNCIICVVPLQLYHVGFFKHSLLCLEVFFRANHILHSSTTF